MSERYNYHQDPGHGWLQVELKELHHLGIEGKISGYSYTDGVYAYLEEDCDMAVFLNAKAGREVMGPQDMIMAGVFLEDLCTNADSFIRSLKSYRRK